MGIEQPDNIRDKDCMERKGYVKIADSLPTTVEPGVGGSGVNIG